MEGVGGNHVHPERLDVHGCPTADVETYRSLILSGAKLSGHYRGCLNSIIMRRRPIGDFSKKKTRGGFFLGTDILIGLFLRPGLRGPRHHDFVSNNKLKTDILVEFTARMRPKHGSHPRHLGAVVVVVLVPLLVPWLVFCWWYC